MNREPPKIIQGGMGFGISGWMLAQAVSRLGQLGVVSGTALDYVVMRCLQDGDPGGHVRRALDHFPFQEMVRRVMDQYYIPGGRAAGETCRGMVMHDLEGRREPLELCIIGNFVEIFLAREGHDGPVGINYLEKIQIPHLPSIYGALLAGSLSEQAVYEQRRRVCDMGFLRQACRRKDGTIVYRCPAEPVAAYVAKGGREEETVGRKCLCNALAANMGLAQKRPDGTYEKPLVTMGDTLTAMGCFCVDGCMDFSAEDIVNVMITDAAGPIE